MLKCKNCKYYDKINDERGYCLRFPPQLAPRKNVDLTERHPMVTKNDKECGEFVQKE